MVIPFIFILIVVFSALGQLIAELSLSWAGVIALVVLLFIIVLVLKYVYEVYYLKYYFFDFGKGTLIIRKGVFSKNEITLPINRLQDVYVDQDILDRIFGLYDVHVSSATMVSGLLSHIDGLNKENAETIKKMLLAKIHA